MVVGIFPGDALWVLTPGRSIELVDFTNFGTAFGFRGTADRSARGFSPGELEDAIQLAAAQVVDYDAGARVSIP